MLMVVDLSGRRSFMPCWDRAGWLHEFPTLVDVLMQPAFTPSQVFALSQLPGVLTATYGDGTRVVDETTQPSPTSLLGAVVILGPAPGASTSSILTTAR